MVVHEVRNSSLIIRLPEHSRVVSSDIEGGIGRKKIIVNHTIEHNRWKGKVDPWCYKKALCKKYGYHAQSTLVLFTAVSQSFLATEAFSCDEVMGRVFVTAGVANARAVGDEGNDYPEIGTINTIVVMENALPDGTLMEIYGLTWSVKTSVLQELGIKSSLSGRLAIGTGTDATVVATTRQLPCRSFAGLHTKLGELHTRALEQVMRDTFSQAIKANPFNKRFIKAA